MQQAIGLYRARRADDAAAICRDILAHAQRPEAAALLARIERERGRAAEALPVLERARSASAGHPALEIELGAALVVANRAQEALPILERLAAAQPRFAPAHLWLGQALLRLMRAGEGIAALERARDLEPGNPETLYALGAALLAAGRPSAAEQPLRACVAAHPGALPALHALATAIDRQNRADEAIGMYRDLLARAPGYPPAVEGLARQLQARGEYEQAIELVRPALADARAASLLAPTYAAICAGAGRPEQARTPVEAALRSAQAPHEERPLRFALARIDDAAGRHDEAFAHYRRANDLVPRAFDAASRDRFIDHMLAGFSAEAMPGLPRASVRSDRPVIVCGMPRSGTTLVEQIIASHPQAFGAGELPHLRAIFVELLAGLPQRSPRHIARLTTEQLDAGARRYLAALDAINGDARRVVDKMPNNCEILGFVAMLLPGARVIHCTRDPVDTCVSCYTTQLPPVHNYATRLEDLGAFYGGYRRLMDHWRSVPGPPMLEVAYEELVAETEAGARRIIHFLGLPWDDRCLRFYENPRLVSTASVDQVRRPIYRSSVARWKRYERHLGPLRESLRAAGVEA